MSPSTNQNSDSKPAAKQGVASDPSKIAAQTTPCLKYFIYIRKRPGARQVVAT